MSQGKRASSDFQVTIGEASYTLRFSARALAALQDHWGCKSLTDVGKHLETLGGDLSLDDMVVILWASLRTHHSEVSKDDTLDLLDEMGLQRFQESFAAALMGAVVTDDGTGGGGSAPDRPHKPGRSNV